MMTGAAGAAASHDGGAEPSIAADISGVGVKPTAGANSHRNGADGTANAFDDELAAQGPRAADTRPLNAHLGLSGPGSDAFEVYRCPRDTRLDSPMTYPSWPVWDASLHKRSAFSVVGTSYWGNAVRSEERVPPSKDASDEPRKRYHSFGPFLRPASRVPAPDARSAMGATCSRRACRVAMGAPHPGTRDAGLRSVGPVWETL